MIASMSTRGRTTSVAFGTTDVRDLSDGQVPAEVWRVHVMADGTREERHGGGFRLAARRDVAVQRVGAGWRAGAKESWVEIRTPKSRAAAEVSDGV